MNLSSHETYVQKGIQHSPVNSNEKPVLIPQKKKGIFKRKLGKTCCCFMLFIFGVMVFLGGTLYLIYKVDVYVPGASYIIEQVENFFRDTEEEMRYAQLSFAQSAIAIMGPLFYDKDTLLSIVVRNELSSDSIEEYLKEYQDGFKFDISSEVYFENQEYDKDIYLDTYSTHMIGTFNQDRIESTFDISLSQLKSTYFLQGVVKIIEGKTYIKADAYSDIFESFDEYKNTWILVESSQLEEQFLSLDIIDSAEPEISFQEGDIHRLYELLTDDAFAKNLSFSSGEVIFDEKCSCISIALEQKDIENLEKKYFELFSSSNFIQNINVETLDQIEGTLCIGKSDQMIRKISIRFKQEETMHGVVEILVWDYGTTDEIAKPTEILEFGNVFSDVYQEYEQMLLYHKDEYVKSQLLAIQSEVEKYYERNGSYPDKLKDLSIESTKFYDRKIVYKPIKDAYKLYIYLPSGNKYLLKGFD